MPGNLDKIDHIVVVMMENRSFDHMLGYLSKDGANPAVDGLTGTETNVFNGQSFPVFPQADTAFLTDPCHGKDCVADQLSGNNGGFVRSYADRDSANPGAIMGYHQADHLPVYDHLAREFTVCDHWFASVPGPTWPNRLYSLAGTSDGLADAPPRIRFPSLSWTTRKVFGISIPWPSITWSRLPAYTMKTIFEFLDEAGVDWTYFDHDIAFLRVFKRYRANLSHIDRIEAFYDRCLTGDLPALSWIDPNFTDVGSSGSDDHPPADVTDGQALIGEIYNALLAGGNDLWSKTLLVLTYDEHGGFYDHVAPPACADDRADFRQLGVRVPALIASPWVAKGHAEHTVFDHSSVLRTVLARFCTPAGCSVPSMTARVVAAIDLSLLLSEPIARTDSTPAPKVMRTRAGPPRALGQRTELEELMTDLRQEALASGVPPHKT